MKKLYEFQAWKEQEVEEVKIDKNDKGEEIKISTKVKKYIPHKFFLRKPNRALYDDAELFYGVELSLAMKEGLLTKAQLATKFSDEVGTLSQNDRKKYVESYTRLLKVESEFQTKTLKKEEERNQQEKDEINQLLAEMAELRTTLQEIESTQQSLFDYTAETRARNKTILWWVFNLTYYDNGQLVFGPGDFKSKLAKYDEFEENEDNFMVLLGRRLMYLVSFWYTGRAEDAKEFDEAAKLIGLNVNPEEVKSDPVV